MDMGFIFERIVMEKFYLLKEEEVFKEVNSSPEGLSSAEAQRRLELNGKNKLEEAKKESLFKKFINSISDESSAILRLASISDLDKSAFCIETASKRALSSSTSCLIMSSRVESIVKSRCYAFYELFGVGSGATPSPDEMTCVWACE